VVIDAEWMEGSPQSEIIYWVKANADRSMIRLQVNELLSLNSNIDVWLV